MIRLPRRLREHLRDDENPWDWANRARIGGFAGGLIGAGIAIAVFGGAGVLITVFVATFVVVGAIVGVAIPSRP